MEGFRYLDGVASLRFSEAACTGCGMCEQVCPHRVFAVARGKARILDKDLCMECGACATNCPAGSISVRPGVGCATAIMKGWRSGSEEKT
jgi:NAD-dependent dihydropyrimidine dehydrogenase PreA subunit